MGLWGVLSLLGGVVVVFVIYLALVIGWMMDRYNRNR